MKKRMLLSAALAGSAATALVMSWTPEAPASAVPRLSGLYAVTQTQICQPDFVVANGAIGTGAGVTSFAAGGNAAGDLRVQVGTVLFTPTSPSQLYSGTTTLHSAMADGTVVNVTETGGGTDFGALVINNYANGKGVFSNDASTLILFDDFHVYPAVAYAEIVSGIAHHVDYAGADHSNQCIIHGTLTRVYAG